MAIESKKCTICFHVYGSWRSHCDVCGASSRRVFWMQHRINSWHRTHVDIDRPIHRATSYIRDARIVPLSNHPDITVVSDPYLQLAQILSEE